MSYIKSFFTLLLLLLSFYVVSFVDAGWITKPKLLWWQQAAAIWDINQDGFIDIYVWNGNLYWRNDGLGNFTGAVLSGVSATTSTNPSLWDVNNDGILDIFLPWWQLWVSTWLLSYISRPIASAWAFPVMSFMFDFNNDALLDIYVTQRTSTNRLWRNTGTGFVANNIPGDTGNMNYYTDATYLDFNNDWLQDIYVVWTTTGTNRLWRNTGTGFVANNIPGDIWWYGTVALDYNSDGWQDLYVVLWWQNRLWRNNGNGTFSADNIPTENMTWGGWFGVDTGDMNNDGLIDLVVSEFRQTVFFLSNGDGTFNRINWPYIAYGGAMDIEVADYNGDGFQDVYAHDFYQGELWLWVNDLFITINAPTKLQNAPITNTTIVVTGAAWLFATWVTIDPTSTVSTSNFNCIQINSTRVECSVQINSSWKLVIKAIDKVFSQVTKTELNYIIDTISPSVPNINVNTQSPYSLHAPQITFASTDNIALSYCEVEYLWDDWNIGTMSGSIIIEMPSISPLVINLDPDEILHTVTVRCYDTAGNVSQNIVRFPPLVNFTTPTQISNISIEDATVTLTSPQDNDLDNIQITSTITPAPTVTNCIWSGNDTTEPYASPAVCEIHGVSQSWTVQIAVRDTVTLAIWDNSTSFIIDIVSPIWLFNVPTLLSHTGITNTTVTITDDIMIYATWVTLSWTTTANISNFSCVQINTTTVECSMQVNDDGDIVIQIEDYAGNIISVAQTGYVIDTIYPVINILDDANPFPNTWDTISVNVSDDMLLETWSLLYGFSADVLCNSGDSYVNVYESWSGIVINDETYNGQYLCFQAIDHVGNTTYIGTTNPLKIDITAPNISFISGANMVWEVNTTFIDPWYTVSDNFSSSWSIIVSVAWVVDTSIFAMYPIIYTITDTLWNTKNVVRNVTVVDTTAPILTGVVNQVLEVHSGYIDSYAVSDNYRSLTGMTVTISGIVNTWVLWTYPITYIAVDNSGNIGTISKIVSIVDTTKPIVTLHGLSEITIEANSVFDDQWAIWSDNYDGTWSIWIATTWQVNTTIPWSYILSYLYTDTSGNTGNALRTVIVKETKFAWWGWWNSITKDNCPKWDYTSSYYDNACGTPPVIDVWDDDTSVDEWSSDTTITYTPTQVYNASIANGKCYQRKSDVSIINSKTIQTTQEFKKALSFLYVYDMTVFNAIAEFDPYRTLTREEAAKIFSNFAMNVLCRKPDESLTIQYGDVENSDLTLKPYITLAYQLWLMKWDENRLFRSKDDITKAELNAVLVRMILKSYLPENTSDSWYTEYNAVSSELGIIKYGADLTSLSRNNAALMLFRAYKEQKFSLQYIDYESFVLDTRDEYIP